MTKSGISTNRILVVDDDPRIIDMYLRCLDESYDPDFASTTRTELEKVLFDEETGEDGFARFDVQSHDQGEAAVADVAEAARIGRPYSVIVLDVRMPPGIDGIEAAKQIRAIDPYINIVIVTGAFSRDARNLATLIPPEHRFFFFKKPFHAVEFRQLVATLCAKWHTDLALREANETLEQRVRDRTAELYKLAYVDPVTSLPNRRKLADELQLLIDGAICSEGKTAVILLDIDQFNFVNETMGYECGTKLLAAIGNRLRILLREPQIKQEAIVGRFGADEFACLMTGIENGAVLRQLVKTVKQTIEAPFVINGRDLFLITSIGVAWSPMHGHDSEDLLRRAEAALHRSRRRRNDKVTYYHSNMQNRALHRFDMEAELRKALEAGHIIAHFQPQQCLKSGTIAGAEALARWTRPDGTSVPPSDFVPVADEVIGMSDILFETMLRSVCNALSRWRAHEPWAVPIGVNLSARQLSNRNLAGQIKLMLEQHQVDPQLINFELTETVLLEDLAMATRTLSDLSAYGVGIHIDDFGTGYSSMRYLAELPVQALKIDVSFVGRMTESTLNARIVQAITALGKALNLEIIAEGVETKQQLMALKNYGCDLVQGFLIGKPMAEPDFYRWCESIQP